MNTEPDQSRVDKRARLTPEERAAGSADARLQAQVILEDSDERTADPEGTRYESSQTPDQQDHHGD